MMLSVPFFSRLKLSKFTGRRLAVFPVLVLLGAGILRADSPNLLTGDFESGTPSYNPWTGVDDSGLLHVWAGSQSAVDDSGKEGLQPFSPSITMGDLNGDGLADLVVADPRGYFWFYPNSGKPGAPVFTKAEIMPIWLESRSTGGAGDLVPRIQLIDYMGEGKLSIVASDYAGRLFYLHNHGSATMPDFRMPDDRASLVVATHSDGLLWCNYLMPFLYDWSGTGRLDLTMGDGSYSANSIYLFTNQGTNSRPVFNEKHRLKIIPGMGREDLTPQVVDWNNDGKADIIAGERTGYINVYLNQNKDNSYPPTFDRDHPIHVMFGSIDKFSPFSTVCVADLNGDKLFDLILGNQDGGIFYALNTGTPGAPKFGTPVPFKSAASYEKIIAPESWRVARHIPYGASYEVLQCVNAQIEPGFTPPPPGPDFKGHGAAKFSILLPQFKYFKDQFVIEPFNPAYFCRRAIEYTEPLHLDRNTRYTLSFWVRSEGAISDLSWFVWKNNEVKEKAVEGQSMPTSSSWTRVSQTVELPDPGAKKGSTDDYDCQFRLNWNGDGTIYFDDITLKKKQ